MKNIFLTLVILVNLTFLNSCGDAFKRVDTIMGHTSVTLSTNPTISELAHISNGMDFQNRLMNSFSNELLAPPTDQKVVFARRASAGVGPFPEKTIIVPAGSNSATMNLPNDTYNFNVVGYFYPNMGFDSSSYYAPWCATQASVSLGGTPVGVTLNTANCGPGVPNRSNPIKIALCAVAVPAGAVATCASSFASIQYLIHGNDGSGDMTSTCIPLSTGVSAASVDYPNTGHFVSIVAYPGTSCSGTPAIYALPKGIDATSGISNGSMFLGTTGADVSSKGKFFAGAPSQLYIDTTL